MHCAVIICCLVTKACWPVHPVQSLQTYGEGGVIAFIGNTFDGWPVCHRQPNNDMSKTWVIFHPKLQEDEVEET